MSKAIDIIGDVVLSCNGEDIHIKATKNKITATLPPLRSCLQGLAAINVSKALIWSAAALDDLLKKQNCKVYVDFGLFKVPILGFKGSGNVFKRLIQIGDYGKRLGLV